jgi:hypothetical protein
MLCCYAIMRGYCSRVRVHRAASGLPSCPSPSPPFRHAAAEQPQGALVVAILLHAAGRGQCRFKLHVLCAYACCHSPAGNMVDPLNHVTAARSSRTRSSSWTGSKTLRRPRPRRPEPPPPPPPRAPPPLQHQLLLLLLLQLHTAQRLPAPWPCPPNRRPRGARYSTCDGVTSMLYLCSTYDTNGTSRIVVEPILGTPVEPPAPRRCQVHAAEADCAKWITHHVW